MAHTIGLVDLLENPELLERLLSRIPMHHPPTGYPELRPSEENPLLRMRENYPGGTPTLPGGEGRAYQIAMMKRRQLGIDQILQEAIQRQKRERDQE